MMDRKRLLELNRIDNLFLERKTGHLGLFSSPIFFKHIFLQKTIFGGIIGMTTSIETLRTLLQANKITTEYSDEELEALIQQSLLLVNAPYTTIREYNDYVHEYGGAKYITQHYPLLDTSTENVTVLLNNEDITDNIVRITRDGIIYFKNTLYGHLDVTYTVGLDDADINNYIIPIALYLIKDNEGKNINSVTEGDVSVSYSNLSTSTSAGIDALINNLRNRYGARVRLI